MAQSNYLSDNGLLFLWQQILAEIAKNPHENTTYTLTKNASGEIVLKGSDSSETKVKDSDTKYTLPTASASTLGGVKVDGSTIKIINGVISAVGGVKFTRVSALPQTGETNVIYLLSNAGAAPNVYDEYIWCDVNGSGTMGFEKIGTTDIDLSGYVKSSDLHALTNAEVMEIINSTEA